MNLSPLWKDFFVENGFEDTKHWSEIGQYDECDRVIFEYARKHSFIVFTNDSDFGAILASTNFRSPSVFQIKYSELLPQKVGKVVLQIIKDYENELVSGALLIAHPFKERLRLLPLRDLAN